MPDIRITELPTATSVSLTDTTVVVQNGITKRATAQQLATVSLGTQTIVTVADESSTLSQSRRLAVSGSGISAVDGGAGSTLSISLSPSLQSLSSLVSTGMVVQTSVGALAARSLVQPAAGITITNSDGVAGNPTFSLSNDLAALEGLSGTGFSVRTATDTWTSRSITVVSEDLTVSNGDGIAGSPQLGLATSGVVNGTYSYSTLTVDTKGRITSISSNPTPGTVTSVAATAPSAGFTISGSPITSSGNFIFTLANDLSALEGLSGTGFAVRTAADTWAQRTITGTAAEIAVTNGDGVVGSPILSLPASLTFTGKTVTGGTFTTPTITVNDNQFTIQDNADNTKKVLFEASGITTGTTRTLTLPNENDTLATVGSALAMAVIMG